MSRDRRQVHQKIHVEGGFVFQKLRDFNDLFLLEGKSLVPAKIMIFQDRVSEPVLYFLDNVGITHS